MFVVFDWDGTLSDDRHRHHLLPSTYPLAGGPWDYSAYHEACIHDPPIVPMLQVLFAHAVAGHRVEIWTGRDRAVETQSRQWLKNELRNLGILGMASNIVVKMREEEGSVIELKRKWLRELPPAARPDLAYDDRADVVEMWKAEGVMGIQVHA